MLGLLSFANENEKAAEQIQLLLAEAQQLVLRDYWSWTPISWRATASIHLLSQDQIGELLKVVQGLIGNSGSITDRDMVAGSVDGSLQDYKMRRISTKTKT